MLNSPLSISIRFLVKISKILIGCGTCGTLLLFNISQWNAQPWIEHLARTFLFLGIPVDSHKTITRSDFILMFLKETFLYFQISSEPEPSSQVAELDLVN